MNTINKKTKIMTRNNFSFSSVLTALFMLLCSCAGEELHINDDALTKAVTITHTHAFAFDDGDAIGIFTKDVWNEYSLAGIMEYDSQTGQFVGDPDIENGQPCRVIYTNCNPEGGTIHIPQSQSFDSSLPLYADIQWNGNSTIPMELYKGLTTLRISGIDNTIGFVTVTAYDTPIAGQVDVNSNMSHFDLLNVNNIVYPITPQDVNNGYVDIILPANTFERFTVKWNSVDGNYSHTKYLYDFTLPVDIITHISNL